MRVLLAVLASLALAAGGGSVGQYCGGGLAGIVTLTGESGTIRDHEGGGNYLDNSDCWWTIRAPENYRVFLEFTFFDTEYGFDAVWVHDGPSLSDPLALFLSGPTAPHTFESNANAVTIIFQSDRAITRRGFEIVYHFAFCSDGCNDNGICRPGGQCVCNPGFLGPTCAQTSCTNTANCSGHGMCVNDTCICEAGYYGGDCANPYCQPSARLTSDSGSFSEHNGAGEYLNNMACSWEIDPDVPGSAVLLEFDRFDLEQNYDFLAVFDGLSASAPLLANLSGHSLPPRITGTTGSMRLEFTSDVGIVGNGFGARYRVVQCRGQCSGNGWCIDDGLCHCISGWTGSNCSIQTCTNNCDSHGQCVNNQQCQCDAGWIGPECGTCDEALGTCEANGYCAGVDTISSRNGTVQDHFGPGDYRVNSDCSWELKPDAKDATNMVVQFRKVDLVPGSARVVVYDSDDVNSHVIGQYSGMFMDSQLPPIVASGTSATIKFTSDSNPPSGAEGFVASYRLTTCPDHCSYNGHCNSDGTCHCRGGFAGANCNTTVCHGDCGQAANTGSCDTAASACVCKPGWFGSDCSQTHCSGVSTITSASGSFSDHGLGATYQPNSRCDFIINPQGANISLFFPKLQLFNATIDVFDTNGGNLLRLGPYSFTRSPPPFRFSLSQLRVVFTSGRGFPAEGFDAIYSLTSECGISDCGGHGSCLLDQCFCDPGFTGPTCSPVKMSDIEVLLADTEVTRNVSTLKWRFFRIYTEADVSATYLAIKVRRLGGDGNPEFYLNEGSLPSHNSYSSRVYYYFTSPSGDPDMPPELRFRDPKPNQAYYVGVFDSSTGTQETRVSLEVTYRCASSTCSGHGKCNTIKGTCQCEECWTGVDCASVVEGCGGSLGGLGLVIILMIVLLCACCFTFGVLVLYNRNSRYYARLGESGDDDDASPWWAIAGGRPGVADAAELSDRSSDPSSDVVVPQLSHSSSQDSQDDDSM